MTRPTRARLLAAIAVVAIIAGCSQSKLSESGGVPTTPPAFGQPAPGPTAVAPTTTPRELPAVCGISDAWGLAIIRATDPAQSGGLSQTALEADLNEKASAITAALPEHADAIATRTEVAKRKLAGTATEADTESDKVAAETLNVWYVATCR